MSALPIAFAAPAVLWTLALLPVLWWLLRATPPRPQDVSFAPTRLLLKLTKREETPSKTPWWLLLIRLTLAALVIIALAQPILRPSTTAAMGDGPVLIAIDNTFGAAQDWPDRVAAAERLIAEAEARPIILAGTAERRPNLSPTDAATAAEQLRGLSPEPYRAERARFAERLPEDLTFGAAIWLTDGLATDGDAEFVETLISRADSPLRILQAEPGQTLGITDVANDDALRVTLIADASPGALPRTVRVSDQRGFVLAEGTATFAAGDTTAEAALDIPTELRNDAARVTIAGARNAAAVHLLDERFRRRTVGLISGGSADLAQPLLSPLHFLRAALEPSSDLREPVAQDLPTAVDELIDAGTSVIVLADVGTLLGTTQDALARWINAGGVLLRFAGPRTADGVDDLVPVAMRDGARTLGGTLSWDDPQPVTDFNNEGPFAAIDVPGDITVSRQVLAEPSLALAERTWAALADGTPFITGRQVGAGHVVFVHVTADPAWSTFPLSNAYVEILRKIVELSAATEGGAATGPALAPYRLLDGSGRLIAPGPDAEPLPATVTSPDATHPPGLYGTGGAFRALNVLAPGDTLAPLDATLIEGATMEAYTDEGPTPLRGPLLTAAATLLLVDAFALLLLMGAFARRTAMRATALALAFLIAPQIVEAQEDATQFAMDASLTTRLAYVATGNAQLDQLSEAGLNGLSNALFRRTAVEPGEPMSVNIETDEMAFFPLLYWPVDENSERPSDAAIARVDAYMKNGGTILFDTRDQAGASLMTSPSPATLALRRILDGLDIPALEPVPLDHVLTKTFYLLNDFPGRWAGSPLWTEALTTQAGSRPARAGDGVSPILITANDLAGAWAINDTGAPMFPMSGNDPFQRERALRAGINIALYTMTGNYKADQVHIPALLQRLGQ